MTCYVVKASNIFALKQERKQGKRKHTQIHTHTNTQRDGGHMCMQDTGCSKNESAQVEKESRKTLLVVDYFCALLAGVLQQRPVK